MRIRNAVSARVLGVGALFLAAAVPAWGAGFAIYEHGAKAMGMAGAFTAQADDPSAMFFNVAGLAFQEEREFAVGATLIALTESAFRGADPSPGSDVTGEQEKLTFFPSHFYWVEPIGDGWTFGLSFNSPFGLSTEWKDPDNWPGRFLSYEAALRTYDLGLNLGWRVSPRLGVGLGVLARGSDVELRRRIGTPHPFTFQMLDVADVRLDSNLDFGYGFVAGILYKVNQSFSWAFSYRGEVTVDYEGGGLFTQISTGIPAIDFTFAQVLPFGTEVPVETSVQFPDMASLGLAFSLSPNTLLEIDLNWTGWASFERLVMRFPENPLLTGIIEERWDDAYNYRLGLRWSVSPSAEVRLGYVYDETPQPDETVSPLLPDSDRSGFTVGYGHRGGRLAADFAVMYLPFDERTTNTNVDGFNGSYETTGWLFAATVSW